MNKIFLGLFIIIAIIHLCSCESNPIEIKKERGKVAKVNIDMPIDACKLRGKHDEVKVKCKWKIDNFHFVKKEQEVIHAGEDHELPTKIYHKSTYRVVETPDIL